MNEENERKLKAMLEKTKQTLLKREEIYFSLLQSMNENAKYCGIIGKNIYQISMQDQIPYLQALAVLGEIAKEICEKYDFEDEGSEE